jgi:inosine/xanthosine triphosphate pyrophosphatase family protein
MSLDVEGVDVGPLIKSHISHLSDYEGKKATATCLLAVKRGDRVFVYRGSQEGVITSKRGQRFGFGSVFQPLGSTKTWGEELPENHSRAVAIRNLLSESVWMNLPLWNHAAQVEWQAD